VKLQASRQVQPKALRAFTLVELLVVIAIIGVLVALLLPAVQAAREAARRTQCVNNLKQIGLSMHNYLSAKKAFPPGSYWDPVTTKNKQYQTNGNEATWITFLLPYLEEPSLYDKIDWKLSLGGAFEAPYPNRAVTSAPLIGMRCPSSEVTTQLWLDAWMRGNYAANNGIGPMLEWIEATQPSRMSGAFFREFQKLGRRPKYYTDGLGKTAFVSEVLIAGKEGSNDDVRGVMHYPEGPLYHHNYTPNDGLPDELRDSTPPSCLSKPNTPCRKWTTVSPWYRAMVMTARSAHAGGVNLLMGDGSVQFASDVISTKVWKQALATPQGGEMDSISF